MPLQSMWFRQNQRLNQCHLSDPAHVKVGDKGDHVALIQDAVCMLDGARISMDEQGRQFYGNSTASAVLQFKTKRKIVNFSYQKTADNIVGRLTIGWLDREMLAYERRKLNSLIAFGIPAPATPRGVVLTQSAPLAEHWATQLARATTSKVKKMKSSATQPRDIVKDIQKAVTFARPGGLLIFAVGHGLTDGQFPNAGGFDLADHDRMRIGGKFAFRNPRDFVDVFYDTPNPPPSTPSDKEIDDKHHIGGSQYRAEHWKIYQDLCKVFVDGQLGLIVLATCNVGNSTDFLKKVASQWKTPILAYKDFTWYSGFFPHVRLVLEKDLKTPGKGTNVPFSEICFPLSLSDMVVVSP
jgi:hypothetical protein